MGDGFCGVGTGADCAKADTAPDVTTTTMPSRRPLKRMSPGVLRFSRMSASIDSVARTDHVVLLILCDSLHVSSPSRWV